VEIIDIRTGELIEGGIIAHEKFVKGMSFWLNTGHLIELEEEDIHQIKEALNEKPEGEDK